MFKRVLSTTAMAAALVGSSALAQTTAPAPAAPQAAASEPRDFAAVAAAANALIRAHHYDPAALDDAAYQAMEAKVVALGQSAQTPKEFVSKFNTLWREGPFSHVNMQVARGGADQTAAYLDQMRVGQGAKLDWNGDVAILTVNTMMGLDTIEQIDAAFDEIIKRDAPAVVIDLRKNQGGAFAVRPLVARLITRPFDAGAFVSQGWAVKHRRAPTRAEVTSVTPWDGWSIRAFWHDAVSQPITRLRFVPVAPTYSGRVFVLTSHGTASAAELATDALSASGRVTVIGETTAGQMLSQKPFDLPGGLLLFVPIADYYAFKSGRIEGVGVKPDVAVEADKAMDEALARAQKR